MHTHAEKEWVKENLWAQCAMCNVHWHWHWHWYNALNALTIQSEANNWSKDRFSGFSGNRRAPFSLSIALFTSVGEKFSNEISKLLSNFGCPCNFHVQAKTIVADLESLVKWDRENREIESNFAFSTSIAITLWSESNALDVSVLCVTENKWKVFEQPGKMQRLCEKTNNSPQP